MKKNLFITGAAIMLMLSASAQTTKREAPPKPPKSSIEKVKDALPPPPPPPPSEPPPPPAPPSPGKDMQLPADYEAFLKKNATVSELHWNRNNEMIVVLKSGEKEKYRLNDKTSKRAAIDKYGELPAAPPPPPPPPPVPEPPKRKTDRTLS